MESLARLDQRLTLDGPNGADWRKYLRWDALQEALCGDKQPDTTLLTRVYQRYAASEDGLELVWFLDVQQALRTYIATVNAVGNPQVRSPTRHCSPSYRRIWRHTSPNRRLTAPL